ncbi:hypothetical protein ALC56_09506 [Trachymyrmex septentrionalis]|uniref:Gustatory receptor n=1 Tax=Trachymyrmex septentrionalis TaxID=34720 RepID=A0A151K3M4_9HYME|nr:hypothetical protein ALC56_09506 [Trachymyrmex septentrionalis]
MTETLEKALAPLFIIGSFCNLGMLEYPRGQPKAYLSCLYALVKWGSLTYYYYYPISIKIFWNYKIFFIADFSQLTLIISILFGFRHFKELKMCLRKLAIVDDTLEALGVQKEYQRLRNWIIRITIGWIVYVICRSTYDAFTYCVLNCNFDLWAVTLDKFLIYYPSHIIILSALISTAIIGLVLYMCVHLLCKLFLLTL